MAVGGTGMLEGLLVGADTGARVGTAVLGEAVCLTGDAVGVEVDTMGLPVGSAVGELVGGGVPTGELPAQVGRLQAAADAAQLQLPIAESKTSPLGHVVVEPATT